MRQRCNRRQFLTACSLGPFALAGCGQSSDKDKEGDKQAEEAAREERRIANDLKQIGLAMHNYHDSHGGLPAAGLFVPPPGKPAGPPPMIGTRPAVPLAPVENAVLNPRTTHWRVALLPYIEQDNIYHGIRGGRYGKEYWASRELLGSCPRVYASAEEMGKTRYRVFVGDSAPFRPNELSRLTDFTDGVSNTILVVEAEEAVPWTSPDDLVYNPKKPLPKLGRPGRDGFYACMGDGSLRYFPKNLEEHVLRALITSSGGEALPDKQPGRPASTK